MATAIQKIVLSSSRDIPFNKLVLSQSNVRRVKAGVSIEDLAASIARRGLIQSLSVVPVADAEGQETGMFEVPAGGRRFRALELLVKQKRLAKIAPVPCVVRKRDDEVLSEEVSLVENIDRAPLHPLDQFRAFQDMRAKGKTEEEIAAALFVPVQVVKQRLRLAAASPTLHDVYAEDGMAIVLAALSLLGLGIFGPGIASGIVSGGPQLSAGAAVGTGLAAGGMVAAGVGAVGAAASGGAALAGGAAAAARGGAAVAGGASTAYSLGAAGQSGAGGVASGLGGVARAGGSAAVSPLRRAASRAAESMRSSFNAGGKAAFEATGGSSTMGSIGGDAAGDGAASSGAASAGGPPAWAQRMRRSQRMTHAVQATAHAVRSGDAHGGGSSVNLSEGDR